MCACGVEYNGFIMMQLHHMYVVVMQCLQEATVLSHVTSTQMHGVPKVREYSGACPQYSIISQACVWQMCM